MIAKFGVALVGVICLLIGLVALVVPEKLGAELGVQALTSLGLNTMRADFAAFFLVPAVSCAGALFAGKASWLWPAAFLFLFAALGRILGIVLAGMPDQVIGPIVVELVLAGILIYGAKKLGRR